jgi:hypothetical protein
MSESETPNEQPQPEQKNLYPVCPHCGWTPFVPVVLPFNSAPSPAMPQIRMLIISCNQEKCRRVITVFMLPAAPPQIAVPGSRILRPQ